MGENTKIEWAHHTFNVAWGCAKVSPACTNCYAEAWAKRMGHDVWGVNAPRRTLSADYWRQPLKWDRAAASAGERRRVFCSSMADMFEDHPTLHGERKRLWELIAQTPNLDWLLLTKRPENFHFMPESWLSSPRPNVWLGVTAENQEWADKRIPLLLDAPATVRFISAEPLLGPLDLSPYLETRFFESCAYSMTKRLDWVIVGGESGHGARPMHPAWARSLRDQCASAGVAFHFKQWGEYGPTDYLGHGTHWAYGKGKFANWIRERGIWHESTIPGGSTVLARVGKKEAGRLLDGREWNELPQPVSA